MDLLSIKLALQALWAGILSLIGLQRKDPIQEVYRHDESIAEKQAADLSDRTKPDTVTSLQRGDF
jgi:hypothetical protein